MKRQLESRSLVVQDLFAAPFLFSVPAFQRPFSWTTDNAERLLNDLRQAAADAPDQFYFIGAILLMIAQEPEKQRFTSLHLGVFEGAERPYEVIDGLQRVTTLLLLVAVLRDLLDKAGAPSSAGVAAKLRTAVLGATNSKPRMHLGGADGAFFDQTISETGASLVPPKVPTTSAAQERMLDIREFFVEQLAPTSQQELEKLAAFILEMCALVAIGTNTIDRAFQMFTVLNDAGKPLTRNDILKAELIGAMPQDARALALQNWDDLGRRLGDDFESLFGFISTEFGRGSLSILEAIRQQVAAIPGGATAFVNDVLLPTGNIVDMILSAQHSGAPQSDDINRLLRQLGWLNGQEWIPPLLAYWRRHGRNAEDLKQFLTALDRFAYGIRIVALGNDKRAQRMAAITDAINAGAPAAGPWPQIQFSRDELRNIDFGLRDLHRRSPQICRLVLQRLEEQMGGQPIDGRAAVVWTVEHILPLKVPAQSGWKDTIPDGDDRAKLATCLGNLTLVTRLVNEAAANHDYARKHAVYFGPKAAPISVLTDELRTVPTWDKALIDARQIRLMQAFQNLWRYDVP